MSDLNTTTLLGRLTRDAELRYLTSGMAVLDLRLASNRTFMTNGQERNQVLFIDASIWGKRAEGLSKFMTKGKQIVVQGHLTLDQWKDKETKQDRSKIKLQIENLNFAGGNPAVSSDDDASMDQGQEAQEAPQEPQEAPPSKKVTATSRMGKKAPAAPAIADDEKMPY